MSAPPQRERKKPGRVPTSCAECRRLKLRCDRKVPCENCTKRGCASICPTGSLTTGKGNRLILTSTAELHDKIESMTARIRELEMTLAEKTDLPLQSIVGDSSVSSGSSANKMSTHSVAHAPSPRESENDSFINAFGTLKIGERGETSFMGTSARSEYLIGHPIWNAPTWATLVQKSRLPARVINASMLGHDVTPVDKELRELVMNYRPPLSEAIRLCEIYLEWGRTLWTPISRGELLEDLTGNIYRADSYESISDPHSLSLLFSIFALASLFDLTRPAYSIEAYEYYILSRAALEFSSPSTITTLQTVFALINNIQWLDLSNLQLDPSYSYTLAGLGVKLAYRMGLHLHSARFRLEESIAQKRNTVFWRMFLMDTMLSFYAGRPPNVSLDWVDAPYAADQFPFKNENGQLEMGWHSWSWRFSNLWHEILVAAFGVKIPTYHMILELDRKESRAEPQVILQQYLVLTMKESVLLNMHRRYFLQGLQDSPSDPLKHRYGPSVMAMYRSAWRLIVAHTTAMKYIPDLVARLPLFWSQTLSATIVMCMIVIYAPGSNMAASSMHEIGVIYEVFKKAAPTTSNASNLLEHIQRLWDKIHENVNHNSPDYILSRAELDRVGGGTTSIISNVSNNCPPASTPSSVGPPTPETEPAFDYISSPYIHPRIMQDMQSFDGFQASTTATGELDYAAPARFAHSLMDTQTSQFAEADVGKGQEDLNMHFPTELQPFASPGEAYSPQGLALDPAWRIFMEQLGF